MQKKTIAIVFVSALALLGAVVALTVGLTLKHRSGSSGDGISQRANTIKSLCEPTAYKDVCEETLNQAGSNTSDPKELIEAGIKAAMKQLNLALQNSTALKDSEKDSWIAQGLEICVQCLHLAIDELQNSLDKFGQFQIEKVDDYVADLKTWISGAISYNEMCLESMDNDTGNAKETLEKVLLPAGKITTNSLDIVAEINNLLPSFGIQNFSSSSRRLLSDDGIFPVWVDASKRNLLQRPSSQIKADMIVAQDGSGQYKTLTEALKFVPVRPDNRTFVIHVKEGIYKETALINEKNSHITLIGDGPTKTKFTGSRNQKDKVQTYDQACVTVLGDGFVAKDIGFENTAGPTKEQAVAFRVDSDKAVFYNCRFDGYQDTLLVSVNRQFFRDCTITGTIDFIFGRASSVFQNCLIMVRKPNPGQQCMVTANGRLVNQQKDDSAFVLQNCTLVPSPDLQTASPKSEVFLGRPWKPNARTVVMQSFIDGYFDPRGWSEWRGKNYEQTCYYAEFGNRGPGSSLVRRVNWKGYHKIGAKKAQTFTAGRFLLGDRWIPKTSVPYSAGILKV